MEETGLTALDQDEKKYFRTYKDGKTCYNMIDVNNGEVHFIPTGKYKFFGRYKPCTLELYTKELVPKDATKTKDFAYKYTYKILPDKTKRFRKVSRGDQYICEDELITDTLTTIKDN
jgi:hypothetical protein